VDPDILNIASAAICMRKHPLTITVFDVIANDPGIAGYAIARTLDRNPGLVLEAVSALLKMGLISGVADLRDNFALTETGFGVRELIAFHPDINWHRFVKD
jgi:hypothetical protein